MDIMGYAQISVALIAFSFVVIAIAGIFCWVGYAKGYDQGYNDCNLDILEEYYKNEEE